MSDVNVNQAAIEREALEARVLGGLKDRLMHPELIAVFVEEYRPARNQAQAGQVAQRAKTERNPAKVERKIAGILSAIEDGMYEPSMKTRMKELKVEKARLSSELAQAPEPPCPAAPPVPDGSLPREDHGSLGGPVGPFGQAEGRRGAWGGAEIRMIPYREAPGGHQIDLVGNLAAILALSHASGAASHSHASDMTPPAIDEGWL